MRATTTSPEAMGGVMPSSHPLTEHALHPLETGGVLLANIHNPITATSPWVTEVNLMKTGYLVGRKGQMTDRQDNFFRVVVDGFGHGIRDTVPDPKVDSGLTIVHQPGFIEKIEAGSAYDYHTSISLKRPDARVISIASDGIGDTGDHLTRENFMDHGVREMGERHAHLVSALVGDSPTILSACSMGTVIKHYLLLYDALHGHNLHVRNVDYAHALVSKRKAALIMGVLFPLAMGCEIPREILRSGMRYGPRHLLDQAAVLEERSSDGLPLMRQAVSLLGGVELRRVADMAEEYHGTVAVSGEFDPLRQLKELLAIKQKNTRVHVKTVRFRGHGIAIDGIGGGRSTVHAIERYRLDEELLAA